MKSDVLPWIFQPASFLAFITVRSKVPVDR